MIGKFTTQCFDSHDAWVRGVYTREVVNRNSFTSAGMEWMWSVLSGVHTDVGGLHIAVGDGQAPFDAGQRALTGTSSAVQPPDEGYPQIAGAVITLRATFGERDAVFEWRERGVVTAGGLLLDRAVGDGGRKPFGAVWQVIAELQFIDS